MGVRGVAQKERESVIHRVLMKERGVRILRPEQYKTTVDL